MQQISYDAHDENRKITINDAYVEEEDEEIVGRVMLYPIDEAGKQLRVHVIKDVKYDAHSGKTFVIAEREYLENDSESHLDNDTLSEECGKREIVELEFSSIEDYLRL
ncbi:hypothetical protein J4477_00625 [Candidatus Pacearchaeota archaeon]|nr:hypothetical protein [Candidatus Pacearchaeota archaeon]